MQLTMWEFLVELIWQLLDVGHYDDAIALIIIGARNASYLPVSEQTISLRSRLLWGH